VEWLNIQALNGKGEENTIVAISPSHTTGLTIGVATGV
jgi:hypothetical protein